MMFSHWWQLHRPALLLLTAGYGLSTLPFISKLPFNWDAAQFNLALQHYAVSMHQPHPPGYPLFIVLGKLFGLVVSDNHALVLVAALFGFVSVIMLYQFCYRLSTNRLSSTLIAIAWLLNPLFWLYRETALTYTMDAAASITLGYLVWQTITVRSRGYVLASAVVLVGASAVRPTLLALLLPLFILQLTFHRRNWKLLLTALSILVVGSLAWFIPVCWLSGGLDNYLTHSRNLYGTAAANIQIWEQTKLVFTTLVSSFNVMMIPMLLGVTLFAIRYWHLWKQSSYVYLYIAAWLLPALALYCFVHFGQLGYALILLPPFYLLGLPALAWMQQRWWTMWCGSLLLLLAAVPFLAFTPAYGHPNFFPTTRAELYLQKLARWSPNLFKWNRTIIQESDDYLMGVQAIVADYPSDQTLLVAGRDIFYPSPANGLMLRNDEIFRKLSAVLPAYTVVEIAPQRNYYLQAQYYQMTTVYDPTVQLNNNIRYVLFVLDVLPSGMQPSLRTEAVTIPGTNHQLHVGVIDQPWTFGNTSFVRQADLIVQP